MECSSAWEFEERGVENLEGQGADTGHRDMDFKSC